MTYPDDTKGYLYNTKIKKWWLSEGNGLTENIENAHPYTYKEVKHYLSHTNLEFQPISTPISATPLFEVGKSYKTTKGKVVTIISIEPDSSYPLKAIFVDEDDCGTISFMENGLYWDDGGDSRCGDLVPGAIKDISAEASPEEDKDAAYILSLPEEIIRLKAQIEAVRMYAEEQINLEKVDDFDEGFDGAIWSILPLLNLTTKVESVYKVIHKED